MRKFLSFLHNSLSYFLLFFGIGLGAYVFLKILAKDDLEIAKEKSARSATKVRDTTFVQLINVPSFPYSRGTARDTQRAQVTILKADALNQLKGVAEPKQGARFSSPEKEVFGPQTMPKLQTDEAKDISSNVLTETTAMVSLLQRRAYQNRQTLFSLSIFLLLSLTLIGLAFFTRNPDTAHASMKDVNPRELDELYIRYADRIRNIRNPRKILRLKNSIAYHFYFLKNSHLITTENLNKTMEVLLALVKDSSLADPGDIKEEELKNAQWFYKKLVASNQDFEKIISLPQDTDVLMLILKLNADIS